MTTNAGRATSTAGRLAKRGFADPARAERLLASPPIALISDDDRLLESLGHAADPDLALGGLARLAESAKDPAELMGSVVNHERLRTRLIGVLGTSAALGDHLARHPEHWRELVDDSVDLSRPTSSALRTLMLEAVGANPLVSEPIATNAQALDALRVEYRRLLLGLAARDLSGAVAVEDVAGELADLAGATLDAALAVARAELPPDAAPVRLAVIALGKCGGRELNYVSDVDVVYVAEPLNGQDEAAALRSGNQLAAALARACSATTSEGTIWPVDAALRPEGKAGPLVRTLASHVSYYERWASTWEFQALLKARPVAGDLALGRAYIDALMPMVWRAADRAHFVDDVRAMRRRVEENIPRSEADRQLKLGPGGLRDVEFSVQLLQLVHGRSDFRLRSGTTLTALEALSTHGYVGRHDAADLDRAYRFLRTLEHRIQLFRLRRTHVLPDNDSDLRRIARSMGFRADPVNDLLEEWRKHQVEVRRLHEKLFYRPLLQAVARLDAGEARLTPDAARERLRLLGYADPDGALRHLEALTAGLSRRAAIQKTLLPVMLGWFAEYPDPDAGLLGFRQVSDALGSTHWYLGLLRDGGATAERLARLLASSRYVTDLLLRAPEAVRMLGDDAELEMRSREALTSEMRAAAGRYANPVDAIRAVRAVRRRELFRVAAADLLGQLDVEAVGTALTDIAAATITGGLDAAVRAIEAERRSPLATRFAVIAMGRFGGCELGYGSDADVLFVHDPVEGVEERDAHDAAHAVANELRRLLAIPTPDPPLLVDADLRPEGKNGPMVRTIASYAAYYARWSAVWESQALLRAEPIAGDPDLGKRFTELIDPLRYPPGGLGELELREIRRIKARVEAERLPRGADPTTHTKLGRGGLADVEWTVQTLQLTHGHDMPSLRTTRTLEALAAASKAGLIQPNDAAALADAWNLATRVRNATMLVRGRASDTLPSDVRELAGVARAVGYAPGHTGDLREDYRRLTRRARGVVERVFYT